MSAKPTPQSTTRFVYTPIETKDLHHFDALYRDPKVMAKIMAPLTQQQVSELFLRISSEASNAHFFTITTIESSEISGIMGFLPYPDNPNQLKTAEFGIVLYPHCYRSGTAKASITRLLEFGFQTLKLDEAYAHFHIQNNAIKKIAEHLSFSIEPHSTQSGKTTCTIDNAKFIARNFKQLSTAEPDEKS